MGCLHDTANVQQTSSKCIQNTHANAGRLLDRVNTLLMTYDIHRTYTGIVRGCINCYKNENYYFKTDDCAAASYRTSP